MNEWAVASLDEVADRVAVKNSRGIEKVMTVSAERGLVAQETFFTKKIASANLSGYWVIEPGDFVYNKSSSKNAPWGVVARYQGDQPAVVTPLYIVFRPRLHLVDAKFLHLACNGSTFFDSLAGRLREGARSHGLLNVRLGEFFAASVPLPPLPVQRRIANLSDATHRHIAHVREELHSLRDFARKRKEALFSEFLASGALSRLGDVIEEVKRPIIVESEREYLQIGVRSHGRGIFTKQGVAGSELGSKKVYWIHPGDLVINIVFAWEGAVAVMPDTLVGFCGSHRFPTYRRLDGRDIDFLRFYFSTAIGVRVLGDCSPGGAGRNRTLNRRRLMDTMIPMPDSTIEQEILDELRSFEVAITDLEEELRRLQTLGNGLVTTLMTNEMTIPPAYDHLLEKEA